MDKSKIPRHDCRSCRYLTLPFSIIKSRFATFPSLCSFDVMRDSLGAPRDQWPHTMFLAAGTQASSAKANTVAIMRLTSVSKTHKPAKTAEAEDDESDSDSESDMDEDNVRPLRRSSAGRASTHSSAVSLELRVNC